MNEIIRELARQSHLDVYGLGKDREKWEATLDKFGQLLIAECINVVNRRFMGDLNREDMEVRRCVEDLKKHFGIVNAKK